MEKLYAFWLDQFGNWKHLFEHFLIFLSNYEVQKCLKQVNML